MNRDQEITVHSKKLINVGDAEKFLSNFLIEKENNGSILKVEKPETAFQLETISRVLQGREEEQPQYLNLDINNEDAEES